MLSRVTAGGVALAMLGACEARALIGSNLGGSEGDSGIGSTGAADGTGLTTHVGESGGETQATADPTVGDEADGGSSDGARFDVGFFDVPAECEAPASEPCDFAEQPGPWRALGLGCPGEASIESSYSGDPRAMAVHAGPLGTSGVFAPREGAHMVVLSTGDASQLPRTPDDLLADGSCEFAVACPNTELGGPVLSTLPPPIDVRRVAEDGRDCSDDDTLVGTGDCSNTLWNEWIQGQRAVDYAELRFTAAVPEHVDSLAYDFAFFSAEYPSWIDHHTAYNDMYVAWLESERWTGNISFDEMGHPITVNGVFLDYKDAPSDVCPSCEAPELDGFAMDGHAGTKWLTTSAPVRGGESITLVFAIFDMADALYDSVVILDNFEWTCSGAPPHTIPVG